MITFENSPVSVGAVDLLASTISISISDPRRGTKRFGTPGFDSQVREGPAVGRISISYYLTNTNGLIRSLFGGVISEATVTVGEYRLFGAVANSLSMTIEPYSVVSCTLEMSFYDGYDQDGSEGTLSTPADVIHGGASEVSSDLLWGNDIVSCQYTLSHSVEPVYPFGELIPTGYTRDGGSVEITLAGTGLGHIIDYSTVCEGYTSGVITLAGLCPSTDPYDPVIGGDIPFSGYVINPEITVAPNEEINGSLTVFGVL